MSKVLYVVDTSNWLYKFDSVYNLKKNVSGVNVNVSALYGMVRAIKANPFTDIMFVLDGTPEMSNRLLTTYKGTRSKEDVCECRIPTKTIVKTISALGPLLGKNIFIAASPGQEADQVASSVAHIVSKSAPNNWRYLTMMNHFNHTIDSDRRIKSLVGEDFTEHELDYSVYNKCIIATTDSDMYQLQRLNDVFIDTSTNGSKIKFDEETPVAVHNIKPSAIMGYKMLCGDVSDAVPKIKLSLKTEQLVEIINKELDSLEKCSNLVISTRTGDLTSLSDGLKQVAKDVIANKEQSRLSKNLAVVSLIFYSAPYILSYKLYDAKKVLNKYKIKL